MPWLYDLFIEEALPALKRHSPACDHDSEGGSDLPVYNGDYSVTSDVSEDIILSTAQKVLHSNIRVRKILYAEVSNEANGITVTIGGE